MTEIEKTIQEIENVDLKSDDAIDVIHNLISTKLRRLPIFMTDLKIGEPLVRSRYLNEDEDFHRTIQDYSLAVVGENTNNIWTIVFPVREYRKSTYFRLP